MGQYISLIPSGLLSSEKKFMSAGALHLGHDVQALHSESCLFRIFVMKQIAYEQ